MKPKDTWIERLERIPVSRWFWWVLGISGVARVVMWLGYPVQSLNDTGAYRRAAIAILDGWRAYDGTRTPGYPFLLALAGKNENVYLAQLFIGMGTTLLFFYIAWKLSKRGWFAALVALAHSLSLQQLFFEANLMTETLATFCVALAGAGMVSLLLDQAGGHFDPARKVGAALVTGLAVSFALITRPLFLFLLLWLFLFFVFGWRGASPKMRVLSLLGVVLPGVITAGLWMNFIYRSFGVYNMSAMSGYHLVQHTGAWFEYVPDEYSALRDIYIKYRDVRIAEHGTQTNTIWEAIPDLVLVTGDSFYGLSRTMQVISNRLIIEHPLLYLQSVFDGWLWFWKVPVYWKPGAINSLPVATFLRWVILLQRALLFSANIAFIAGSLLAVFVPKVRLWLGMNDFAWFGVGALWVLSVAQSLLDHGDNPRFLVPMQSLVVLLVFWGAANMPGFLDRRARV